MNEDYLWFIPSKPLSKWVGLEEDAKKQRSRERDAVNKLDFDAVKRYSF